MTAVETIISKIKSVKPTQFCSIETILEWCEQAKEMEREQHGKTWDAGLSKYEVRAGNYMRAYEDFDDWYAETYGSKGSDDAKTN